MELKEAETPASFGGSASPNFRQPAFSEHTRKSRDPSRC